MNCSLYKEKLHSYISGSLSEMESRAVKKHLELCGDCREEAAQIKKAKLYLAALRKDSVPPPNLKSNIMAAIDLNKYKPKKKKDLSQLRNWGISLVASGLILMVLNTADISTIEKFTGTIYQKAAFPISIFNKSMAGISDTLINLNGATGNIERQIKGGM